MHPVCSSRVASESESLFVVKPLDDLTQGSLTPPFFRVELTPDDTGAT